MKNEIKNKIKYRKVGNYYITNLAIPKNEYADYHIIQSFNGNEVSAKKSNKIGMELARSLWVDKYQILVCIHTNKDNIHIILKSVSFIDGSKYHNSNVEISLLRDVNNDICSKYGLTVIETKNSNKEKDIAYK